MIVPKTVAAVRLNEWLGAPRTKHVPAPNAKKFEARKDCGQAPAKWLLDGAKISPEEWVHQGAEHEKKDGCTPEPGGCANGPALE